MGKVKGEENKTDKYAVCPIYISVHFMFAWKLFLCEFPPKFDVMNFKKNYQSREDGYIL